MIDWITRSRLRTALVIAFFFGVFVFSIHSFVLNSASPAPGPGPAPSHAPSPGAPPSARPAPAPAYREAIKRPHAPQKPSQPAPQEPSQPAPQSQSNALNLFTAAIGMFGTLSTVWFAWRADRRAGLESNAKVMQMQQEIAELRRSQKPPGTPSRSM